MPNYRGLAFPAPERQHSVTFIPLAGMLEAGLRATTSIGEYDSDRALTNEKLEEVRAPPYTRPGTAADSAVERYAPPGPPEVIEGDLTSPSGPRSWMKISPAPRISRPPGRCAWRCS